MTVYDRAYSLNCHDLGCFGFFEIEHPVDAELVDEHTEASAPECVLKRHCDFAVLSECSKEFLYFLKAFTTDGERDVVSRREGHAGHGIGSH